MGMSEVKVEKIEKEVVKPKEITRKKEEYTTVTKVIPKVVFYEIRDSNAIKREYDKITFLRMWMIRPFFII